MAAQPRAILFDALGTLLSFEPPAPHLRAALRERAGVDVGADAAERAIRAEIAYYRAHLDEGRDAGVARRPAGALRGRDGAGAAGHRARRAAATRCSTRCGSSPTRTPRPR